MRWGKEKPKVGDTRIKRWFAWLPVTTIYDDQETRWMETVTVLQDYIPTICAFSGVEDGHTWRNLNFLSNDLNLID